MRLRTVLGSLAFAFLCLVKPLAASQAVETKAEPRPSVQKLKFAPHDLPVPSSVQGLPVVKTYHLELPTSFTNPRFVAKGGYGDVWRCDFKEGAVEGKVVVKRIHLLDDDRDFQKILREIILMEAFAGTHAHRDILPRQHVWMRKSGAPGGFDVYISMRDKDTDLGRVVHARDPEDPRQFSVPLEDSQLLHLSYHMTLGVAAMHAMGLIHVDLKLSNVLTNADCDLHICDFGIAMAKRESAKTIGKCCDRSIGTRWTRAPELFCGTKYGQKDFTEAADLWSLGLMLVELHIRRHPITGKDSTEMFSAFGTLAAPDGISKLWPELEETYPQVFDLVKKLLQIVPSKRVAAEALLKEPYFERMYDPKDLEEIEALKKLPRFNFAGFEDWPTWKPGLRRHLKEKIQEHCTYEDAMVEAGCGLGC